MFVSAPITCLERPLTLCSVHTVTTTHVNQGVLHPDQVITIRLNYMMLNHRVEPGSPQTHTNSHIQGYKHDITSPCITLLQWSTAGLCASDTVTHCWSCTTKQPQLRHSCQVHPLVALSCCKYGSCDYRTTCVPHHKCQWGTFLFKADSESLISFLQIWKWGVC